jgi:uncharacterized RDD family membrane protein YckC
MARIEDARLTYGYQHVPALDPLARPELYEGVLPRRAMAFVLDAVLIGLLTIPLAVLNVFLGIVTLGLSWFLFPIFIPLVALGYNALTMGGPASATPGMRVFGLEMRVWDGQRMYGLLAALHAVVFWFSLYLLTPLVLLVALFSARRRLLHDMLLGTVLVDRRAARHAGL